MSVTLYIDTSAIDTADVSVDIDGKRFEKTSRSKVMKSQMVLPMIEELLHEHTLKLADITAISVVTGPGSFTGLRVGATVANVLGYLLDVPVNGKKALVLPKY